MNAIIALLTAASVLAHAALGCCFDHSHGPAINVADREVPTHEHHHHGKHAHAGHHTHQHSGHDESPTSLPHRHCDEGVCNAVAGAVPVMLVKATHAAFQALTIDLSLHYGSPSLQR